MVVGKIESLDSYGAFISPRLYSIFGKNKSFYFNPILTKGALLRCAYLSFSEFYEHWGVLVDVNAEEEKKYLLSTNWELIFTLLEELKLKGVEIELPEKTFLPLESHFSPNWKFKLKQALLALLESDYQALQEKYYQKVFNHPNSRLNYKLIHPEEIKFKDKTFPTLSGIRTLGSFINRKLEILPMFERKKADSEPKIYSSWKVESLGGKVKFKYDLELCKEVEKLEPELFISGFKAPELPSFS